MLDAQFLAISNAIKGTSFNDQKNVVLDSACQNLTRGFSGPQVRNPALAPDVSPRSLTTFSIRCRLLPF
jgi:hypothetical protein